MTTNARRARIALRALNAMADALASRRRYVWPDELRRAYGRGAGALRAIEREGE